MSISGRSRPSGSWPARPGGGEEVLPEHARRPDDEQAHAAALLAHGRHAERESAARSARPDPRGARRTARAGGPCGSARSAGARRAPRRRPAPGRGGPATPAAWPQALALGCPASACERREASGGQLGGERGVGGQQRAWRGARRRTTSPSRASASADAARRRLAAARRHGRRARARHRWARAPPGAPSSAASSCAPSAGGVGVGHEHARRGPPVPVARRSASPHGGGAGADAPRASAVRRRVGRVLAARRARPRRRDRERRDRPRERPARRRPRPCGSPPRRRAGPRRAARTSRRRRRWVSPAAADCSSRVALGRLGRDLVDVGEDRLAEVVEHLGRQAAPRGRPPRSGATPAGRRPGRRPAARRGCGRRGTRRGRGRRRPPVRAAHVRLPGPRRGRRSAGRRSRRRGAPPRRTRPPWPARSRAPRPRSRRSSRRRGPTARGASTSGGLRRDRGEGAARRAAFVAKATEYTPARPTLRTAKNRLRFWRVGHRHDRPRTGSPTSPASSCPCSRSSWRSCCSGTRSSTGATSRCSP